MASRIWLLFLTWSAIGNEKAFASNMSLACPGGTHGKVIVDDVKCERRLCLAGVTTISKCGDVPLTKECWLFPGAGSFPECCGRLLCNETHINGMTTKQAPEQAPNIKVLKGGVALGNLADQWQGTQSSEFGVEGRNVFKRSNLIEEEKDVIDTVEMAEKVAHHPSQKKKWQNRVKAITTPGKFRKEVAVCPLSKPSEQGHALLSVTVGKYVC